MKQIEIKSYTARADDGYTRLKVIIDGCRISDEIIEKLGLLVKEGIVDITDSRITETIIYKEFQEVTTLIVGGKDYYCWAAGYGWKDDTLDRFENAALIEKIKFLLVKIASRAPKIEQIDLSDDFCFSRSEMVKALGGPEDFFCQVRLICFR